MFSLKASSKVNGADPSCAAGRSLNAAVSGAPGSSICCSDNGPSLSRMRTGATHAFKCPGTSE